MKQCLSFLIGLSALTMTFAQDPCASGRYATDVFSNVTLTSNITYGSNLNFANSNTSLKLDVYEPTGDTEVARPLIVWVHGGSFLGGSKTDGDMVALSNAFAKKGYVCASIDYRTGFFPIDSANAVKAVVRAVQDLRASVRYFYKDRADGTNAYRIDTNNIFVGGSSAGAITSLHLAYLDRSCEIDPYVPAANYEALGGIEGNSGNPCYSSKVNGVINLCGALAQYGWLEAGDLPLCSMHGTTDGTVKYNRGIVNPGVPLMYLDGSRMLHERAQAVGVSSKFYTFLGAGHVPYLGASGAALAYMDTTVNFIRDYLVERLNCNAAPLQQPNNPAQTANLYPYTTCTGNTIIDFCTGAGLSTIEDDYSIAVYPNPANELLQVKWNEGMEASIELVDQSGRLLQKMTGNSGTFSFRVDNLEMGSYVMNFSFENGFSQSYKWIKY
jgi:para-nitrobenzyl esterase